MAYFSINFSTTKNDLMENKSKKANRNIITPGDFNTNQCFLIAGIAICWPKLKGLYVQGSNFSSRISAKSLP